GNGGRFISLALGDLLNQVRAFFLVVIQHLAIQTLDTFVGVDGAFGLDGLYGTVGRTALTGVATHGVATQPVKNAQAGGDGQGSAQGTEIAAVKTLDEQAGNQQQYGKDREGPVADEFQDDGGLEGFDFGHLFGDGHAVQGKAKQQNEDHVLDGYQPFMGAVGHLDLGNAQEAGQLVGQFLQCAERTEPATEGAPVPENQGNGGSNPQNEDQWIHQEVFPAEIGAQGVGERQYIHHGQLGRGVPANPDQGEQQKANTKASVEHLVFG